MKNVLKLAGKALLIIIAAIIIYYSAVVLKARSDTPVIVKPLLQGAVITYADLSKEQLDAILAIEDPAFFTHDGIDLKSPGAGITTITQGLGKKFYFKKFKPGIRKLKLMLVSKYALNALVSKNDQLTLFLNQAYLGKYNGAVITGFENAARAFFGKPFKDINMEQFLSILAMVIAPEAFHVINKPDANKQRVERMKKVISGEYKPKGLMDLYYGELNEEEAKSGLAPASYFPEIYKK
jgi:membrane peptidoglycan carboxypeptidase